MLVKIRTSSKTKKAIKRKSLQKSEGNFQINNINPKMIAAGEGADGTSLLDSREQLAKYLTPALSTRRPPQGEGEKELSKSNLN
ncbi:MAG: hypothetical protein NXI20_09955 [bacterium]|nr:hypothetical protein [bacterium]